MNGRIRPTLHGSQLRGAKLSLEEKAALAQKYGYPGLDFGMAEANRLLDEAGARNVGLTLDSYHWYAGGDSLDTIRQTPAERIVLLHVNDAKDLPREQLIDQDRVLPGEGVIPLADWLRAIAS